MKLTVLIPVYNTPANHLMEAVYSILKQDDGIKHDIVLINDASYEFETVTTLSHLSNMFNNIKVLTLPENSGTAHALNEGHKLVTTEYVAIMGSDDVSDITRFRKQTDFLTKNPDVDILGTNLFAFYDNDIFRKKAFTTSHIAENPDKNNGNKNWFINHGTVIYKNSAVLEVGGYDVTKRRGQDVDLWMRMKNTGKYKFANIPEILYGWRRNKKN